jgi:TRAP-type mannitol/chloroaromatic compound transport system substrate-binding protein
MRKLLITFSIACFALVMVCPAPSAADKVWKWKLEPNMSDAQVEMLGQLPRLYEMIEKNTGGRIKITQYSAGSIVSAKRLLDAVSTGILDMAISTGAWHMGTIPAGAVENGLPFSFRNGWEMAEVLWDYGLADLMREEYGKHGAYYLNVYTTGTPWGLSTKKQIRTLDELKGLKIRSAGAYLLLLKKLGASPVPLPMPEVYPALATGVIDGVVTADPACLAMKFYEVAPYYLLPEWVGGCSHNILVNMKQWNSLPDDLKLIVDLTTRNWVNWNARWYDPRNAQTFSGKLRRVQTVTTLSEADQAKLFEVSLEVWDEIGAKDEGAAKAVQIVKDYYKEVGRF